MSESKTIARRKSWLHARKDKYEDIFYEILIYLLYLIVIAAAFWWLSFNHRTLSSFLHLTDNVELNLDSLASMLGIVAAAMAVIISNRQDSKKELKSVRDQIYQQLELESINLFRFEIDNTVLARITWEDTETYDRIKNDGDLAYQVLQHICQVLNLFEMAVRFRRHEIIHSDVFNSWVAWIYDLCSSKVFLHYWYLEGVRENYITHFQKVIDDGLIYAHSEKRVEEVKACRNVNTDDTLAELEAFRKKIEDHLDL